MCAVTFWTLLTLYYYCSTVNCGRLVTSNIPTSGLPTWLQFDFIVSLTKAGSFGTGCIRRAYPLLWHKPHQSQLWHSLIKHHKSVVPLIKVMGLAPVLHAC